MKIKLMIGFLFISSGLYGMNEDNNKINLLEAMQHVLSKKNANEIVICRLNLSSPFSDSLLKEHISNISAQSQYSGSATKA